ncbi:hypothetical protein [Erwinia piriflorinigrans]|uniref:hypothetical protein n=1 Tax=Erwinia piriflorinigrans TaxID=665097 RepID=UPI0012ED740E|nr:hypothetical protein [Erwinia piriflorinigrans]
MCSLPKIANKIETGHTAVILAKPGVKSRDMTTAVQHDIPEKPSCSRQQGAHGQQDGTCMPVGANGASILTALTTA